MENFDEAYTYSPEPSVVSEGEEIKANVLVTSIKVTKLAKITPVAFAVETLRFV